MTDLPSSPVIEGKTKIKENKIFCPVFCKQPLSLVDSPYNLLENDYICSPAVINCQWIRV